MNLRRAFIALVSLWALTASIAFAAGQVIWEVKPDETQYMKYFGRRVVNVNRAEAGRLVPQEFGWQGNQVIFIFNLVSSQIEKPEYQFVFDIIASDYDAGAPVEPVELDVYAGTNINNLKPVVQGYKITKSGPHTFTIPSSSFYLGAQNFIRVFGRNVKPIGYGENPPNCRFGMFRLVIPE